MLRVKKFRMIRFDHQGNQIDQVDSKIKDMGKVLHAQGEGYQQPIIFRSGSRQVSMSVEKVSLYFLGGDPKPYIGLVPIDPWSTSLVLNTVTLKQSS